MEYPANEWEQVGEKKKKTSHAIQVLVMRRFKYFAHFLLHFLACLIEWTESKKEDVFNKTENEKISRKTFWDGRCADYDLKNKEEKSATAAQPQSHAG